MTDTLRSARERMLAGETYKSGGDPELDADTLRAHLLMEQFNATGVGDGDRRAALLDDLLGAIDEGTVIRPPFHVDYGYQIEVGANCYINFGVTALDTGRITIGDNVLIGPNVMLLTPTHPLDPDLRKAKWQAAEPIAIGDNVWIGGGAIVCPGVTIGENAVIGAGSVVTRDIPPNAVAAGSPARVIRIVEAGT
jgi:maltose O-acetyltransferase